MKGFAYFSKMMMYEMTEFELSGLDAEELGFMGTEERREILEAAGLDPDEYDF